MTDTFDGGAAAPAESSPSSAGVPITPDTTSRPAPLGSQVPPVEKPTQPEAPAEKPAAKPEEKPSKTPGEAVRKANEALKAKAAQPAKAEGPARAEDGKFAPKAPAEASPQAAEKPVQAQQPAQAASPHRDAPSRFDEAAKAEWANAPESVKGAIHRTIRELEQGHQKYREAAEAYEPVRKYADMARQGGQTLDKVLETYVGLEHMIDQNPIGALEKICQMKGFSLRQVAEHFTGQTPDQQAQAREQEIVGLKQTISDLQRQIGGVTQTMQQQREAETLTNVQQFAAQHPRFEELADDIGFFLSSGRTKDLAEAYELAERLNPSSATAATPLIPAKSPAPAQTRTEGQPNPAGLKSITGAPTPGSDPGREPASSTREALRRAFARAG